MDITTLFKARLEHIRNRNKALGTIQPGDSVSNTTKSAKSKLFPGKKSDYYSKAREICSTVTSLKDFIQESRNAYLNISASRSYGNAFFDSKNSVSKPTMTDTERDQIDSSIQKIIQNCQKRILEYERLVETTESIQNQSQLLTHLENVISSLSEYLKKVCVSYSEMRAIRVKRTVDLQAMAKLVSPPSAGKKAKDYNDTIKTDSLSVKNSEKKFSVPLSEVDGSSTGISGIPSYFLPDQISPEEMQILEEENIQLMNQLNDLSDEVAQIETNVVQIAQLQEIFTEKVLQQEKEIDKIANVVVNTTENIRSGNEQIRQAIQKNADFRAWVLFFIIVMSFSLLFLDWYND